MGRCVCDGCVRINEACSNRKRRKEEGVWWRVRVRNQSCFTYHYLIRSKNTWYHMIDQGDGARF